ncbi:MAG: hypothetical protein L3K06_01185 [Thermoplasmata archaeon]|nr:hypothetical protein [Thermoplasmata archaeon]
MVDDATPSGGTQRPDTARDPDLPRTDDPNRQAQEQDDSTKATAGVKFPGGTKIEATSDGTQSGGQVTIPLDPNPPKPVDTTPSVVNPDAPPEAGSCVGEDGGTYPNGWVIFKDNVAVSTCVNGLWMPAAPPPSQPGDYPAPDPNVAVASNDPYGSPRDPYASSGDPSAGSGDLSGSSSDPNDPFA